MKQILLLFFLCFAGSSFAEDNISNIYYNSSGLKCEFQGSLTENILNGLAKCYYDNGKVKEIIPYKDDKINGIAKTYYDTGALESERPYRNDKIHGILYVYHENGALLYEIPFENDNREGVMKSYIDDGSGILFARITYHRNQIISGQCANGRKWTNAEISNWGNGLRVNCGR